MNYRVGAVALAVAGLSACGGGGAAGSPALPQLSAAAALQMSGSCATLASKLALPNTTITAVNDIAAGTKVGGVPAPAHCQVLGSMFPRTSPVDGKNYAIGFELRLPQNWNGRFYYQANGGADGVVSAAAGALGGGPEYSALAQGFAVISSDAGHSGLTTTFGIDPQARLDYGYQAAQKLTPMAKSLIQVAYGKAPDRSYFGGCSNGGRHTMVAMTRLADQYDGFLVGDPGFRLPLAAIANMKGAQTYASLATNPADISTGFTQAERQLVSKAVLSKCDALDGVTDGLVQDTAACQKAFDLNRDVPTCTGARDGTCLGADQKTKIAGLFSGATTSTGTKFYASWPYDAGLGTSGWASWKFVNSVNPSRDPGAVAFIWSVPPENPATFDPSTFALTGNIDAMLAKVNASNATYTESAMSFMTPPNAADLSVLRDRGAKVMLYHGTSDPIFSSDDTVNWWNQVNAMPIGASFGANISASEFARLFLVPGMNHCSGGPATDQFDMLTPLVDWVEHGVAPKSVLASARGTGNGGGVNADVPSTWAPNRTRPLCPYPQVARYKGSGDVESASSFTCQ